MHHPGMLMICLAVAAPPAPAQKVSYGLSAGAALPSNDLHAFNDNPGGTLGAFVDLDVGGGSVFRPRIDAGYLPRRTKEDAGTPYRRDFWTGCLSMDYLYHLSGTRRGLFGIAGAGLYHLETKVKGGALERKDSANQFGGTLGLGCTFDARWDAELRYAYTTFNSALATQKPAPTLTAGTVILAAGCRF